MTPDPWRVELARRAAKDLRALDRPVRDRVLDALDRLAGESPSGGVVKLSGRDEWRLRVGDWARAASSATTASASSTRCASCRAAALIETDRGDDDAAWYLRDAVRSAAGKSPGARAERFQEIAAGPPGGRP